jgi:hypothetical protein
VPTAAIPPGEMHAVVLGHPYLIVKKSQYAALRARADRYPWSDMKERAGQDCAGLSYSSRATTAAKGVRIRDIMGACSLMYVLDPTHRSTYLKKMTTVFTAWPAVLKQMKREYPKSKNRWLQVVPPSSGYFNSVLALDVVHDDLPTATLNKYESALDGVAEWYWQAERGWGTATYGARAIWATYQGDVTRQTVAARQYHEQYLAWLTPDGAFKDGTEYALARNGGERSAKQGYLYVAEHTGVDPTYYDDPRIRGFMEWLMGYAYGPFNGMAGFGDAGSLGRDLNTFRPETAVFTAGRFSPKAAASAARHIAAGIETMPGDLLTYSVTTAAPVRPKGPESQVWPASGAAFWQHSQSDNALMGALWNPQIEPDQVTAHMHREVNALYLAGYGESLLVNSGYNGYGNGALGASWSSIHSSARSSNTVQLAGANHVTAAGDGVDDYLVGDGLDYASGVGDKIYAGAAEHTRNFVMVQPQNNKNGYFISIDEVQGASAGQAVDVFFHPASTAASTVSVGQEYRWAVSKRKPTPTYLSIFLGTAPDQATLPKSVIAAWDNNSISGRSLDARYTTDAAGVRRAVTVLFPHDRTHAKAAMLRLSGRGYSGARVKQGAIKDYAIATEGRAVSVGGAKVTADAAVFRRSGKKTSFFFIRNGVAFDGGDRRGVTSDQPVSVHMRGKSGRMTATKPSVVTFKYPGVTTITVDGTVAFPTLVSGGLRLSIPPGQHAIVLS